MDFCGWRGICGWYDRVNRRGGEWLFGEESVGRIDMNCWIVQCDYIHLLGFGWDYQGIC